jgi:hypothetical protein
MAQSYANSAGQNPEDVYDPDVIGDGPVAAISNIGYRTSAGVLLKFAALSYGSAAANHGYRLSDGRDFSALWAKKGTAVYTLPINGQTYTRGTGRGSATLDFNVKSNGTYSIVNDAAAVLASGTWLPSGDSVSSYTCTFAQSGMVNAPDPGGGTDFYSNSAATQQALTASQDFQCGAGAGTINQNAANGGTVTMKLYKSGVLRSTTTVTFECSAGG